MEIYVDLEEVDQAVVDEAVLAMLDALLDVDASYDEAIVAMGEVFRLIAESDAETVH